MRLAISLTLAGLLASLPLAGSSARAEEATPEAAAPKEADPTEILLSDEEAGIAQWGRGPLEIADPYILALYRARPWATSPEILPHLKGSVALHGLWSNSYAFETNRMAIDAEVRQLSMTFRLGIADRFQAGLHVNYQWRGGGSMDGFIQNFHKRFGLPNADRRRRPRHRYLVTGLQADGTTFELDHKGWGFGDVVLEGRGLITKGGDWVPALTGTVRLRIPTARSKFDVSDGVDWTFGLDASKRLGSLPLIVYSSLAYTYYDETRIDDLELQRHRGFFSIGAEWEILPILSFTVHTWVETRRETILWKDRSGIPKTDLLVGNWISYIAGGFKLEPTQGLTIEAGVLENLVDPETTADFGLFFSVTLEL
ncbi:MAG: DUF3187 family protein [Planctomycetes bacterium]|nr:DUF3187 family protein [Planctomycetota bacterium]